MDNIIAVIITITLTFTVTFVTSTQTGTDDPNAQATAVGGSSGAHEATRIVKRYIPQFVGKREQDGNNAAAVNQAGDENQGAELNTLDTENNEDFLSLLHEIEELSRVNKDDGYLRDNNGNDMLENGDEDIYPGDFYEENSDEFRDFNDEVSDINGIDDEDFRSEENDLEQSDMDKRYKPMFVGKRYKPMFVGKRYRPMFVGKRYRPMFVGKRYRPMFVGKRYRPMFVGKRYRPMFVGKRYQPMFVGKRNQRYTPMFVGKRDYEDKRYKPMFVGKRYIPQFVGKRYRPMFVGKRLRPIFVGKRSEETTPSAAEDQDSLPMVLEKRSVDMPASGQTMVETTHEAEEPKSRRKRSILDTSETDLLKRAWGRYVPWQDIPTYKILKVEGPLLDKRFVTPEFIGRRDSISSILSALNALRIARNEPRIASKRFQAPLFIGKRASETPNTLYWNPASDQSQLLDLESL